MVPSEIWGKVVGPLLAAAVDVDPTLDQCWYTACDAGPGLNYHWVPNNHAILIKCINPYGTNFHKFRNM